MLDHSVGLALKGLKSVGDASKTLLAIEEQKIHIMVSFRGVFEDMLSMNWLHGTVFCIPIWIKSVNRSLSWQLWKSCTGWWMNFFNDLIETSVYDTTNYNHSECMKFVFTTLLHSELDVICDTWNSHRIRNTITTEATIRPAEAPDIIYFAYNDNYLHSVNHQNIE